MVPVPENILGTVTPSHWFVWSKVEMEMSRRRDGQGKMGGANLWAITIAFLMIYNVIMG